MTHHKADPRGYNTIMPYLIIENAASAIDFYKKIFGAKEVLCMKMPGNKIAHAELKVGDSVFMLADEYPDMGAFGPKHTKGSPVKLSIYVDDVDAVTKQAVAAGAKLVRPVQDQFWGDRSGMIEDPFGHMWGIATCKEVVSHDEMRKRFENMMNQHQHKHHGKEGCC